MLYCSTLRAPADLGCFSPLTTLNTLAETTYREDRSNERNYQLPESNLISVREPEARHPPDCLGGAAEPSGMAFILSGSARTKSLRAASSSPERPLT